MSDFKKSRKITEIEGESSRFIDAFIHKSGDVGFYVQDFNQVAKAMTGDSEYEFVTYVTKKHKDDVILALLEKLYTGSESASSDFQELMEANNIPCEIQVL